MQPCAFICNVIYNCCNYDPQTGCNVTQKEENEYEEKQSLKSKSNFEILMYIPQQLALLLHNLKDSKQPGQLYKFIEPSNPGNSHQLVKIGGVKDYVERDDGENVDSKPPL